MLPDRKERKQNETKRDMEENWLVRKTVVVVQSEYTE